MSVAHPPGPRRVGVRIAGTGSYLPEGRMTNADFERLVDTSDEWIVQRTGIRERRVIDPSKGESNYALCTEALRRALDDSGLEPGELDQVIVATVTGEMTCPSTACRVAAEIGAGHAAAFDILAACSGFVFAVNVANALIQSGACNTVGVVGCETLSRAVDYTDRAVSILFGDAAGAAVLKATDDTSRGLIAQSMYADGSRWGDLYLPRTPADVPEPARGSQVSLNCLHMNGREVYKFAVGTFSRLIQETLDKAGIGVGDVDMFVCHQSNIRILESARDRFGIPPEKMYINIDRMGNTSAGSVPVCLDELRAAGRVREGDLVMLVAFGGGLTWASSLWRM